VAGKEIGVDLYIIAKRQKRGEENEDRGREGEERERSQQEKKGKVVKGKKE